MRVRRPTSRSGGGGSLWGRILLSQRRCGRFLLFLGIATTLLLHLCEAFSSVQHLHRYLRHNNKMTKKTISEPNYYEADPFPTSTTTRTKKATTTSLTATKTSTGSITSKSSGSTSRFSNRQRLDQLLSQQQQNPFPRTWVPLAVVDQLDPHRPTRSEFMGCSYVTYYSPQGGAAEGGHWALHDDACPHRLAPLSEGRIERSSTTNNTTPVLLECAYHGWQFDATGQTQRIPQLPMNARVPTAAAASPACVPTYSTMLYQGVLWAWVWSDDPLSLLNESQAHPHGMITTPLGASAFMRDLPYGWDTLLENLADPAHVPFAHHGLQGTRDDAIPIEIVMDKNSTNNKYGFSLTFTDRTMQKYRRGTAVFSAPYVLQYYGNFTNAEGTMNLPNTAPFRLSTICVPLRPGWSRIMIFVGPPSVDEEDTANDHPPQQQQQPQNLNDTSKTASSPHHPNVPKSKKQKSTLVSKLVKTIFSLFPVWLLHTFSNRFLDSDLAFLHYQERTAATAAATARSSSDGVVGGTVSRQNVYYCPAPADRAVLALRNWFRTYAKPWLDQPLPESPLNRDSLFDRRVQHVQICRHCQAALRAVGIWRRNTIGLLTACVVVWPYTRLARWAVAGSVLLLSILQTVERTLTQGGYDHSQT